MMTLWSGASIRQSPFSPFDPLPDWSSLHRELVTRKDLTLILLWQEYKAGEPNGYQYSYFCDLYLQWNGKLDQVFFG